MVHIVIRDKDGKLHEMDLSWPIQIDVSGCSQKKCSYGGPCSLEAEAWEDSTEEDLS